MAEATRQLQDISGAVDWARQCRTKGKMRAWIDMPGGGMLWTASIILLRHLEVDAGVDWTGKRVLEIGSGCGHLAAGLARLGAHVTATESAEDRVAGDGFVHMQASVRRLLTERPGGGEPSGGNGALTAGTGPDGVRRGGTVSFRKLHWGLDDLPPADWSGFDVVILSELYFFTELHEALLGVLRHVLHPGMIAYSIFVDRPFSLGFLALLDDDQSFELEVAEFKEDFEHDCNEDDTENPIYFHTITRRPGGPGRAPR
jgi:SAM-dependent methyltransferase